MQSIREEIDRKEERFRQLSDKVDKNKMVDAEMAAELQGLQAGEERRGSNASQPGDGCLEALWQQLIAFERMELRPLYKGSNVEWERHKGRCQEEKKKEAVKTNKSKTRPVSNGRCRVRGSLGEGGGARKSGKAKDRKRSRSNAPRSGGQMEEDALL